MVLRQLLESLEAQERQLIYLRYFADKTQSEVGKMMGISQVTVRSGEDDGDLTGAGVTDGEKDPAGFKAEGNLDCLASDTAGKDSCITNKISPKTGYYT